MSTNGQEIERKWIMMSGPIPNLAPSYKALIFAAYLHVSKDIEVRISRRYQEGLKDKIRFTVKEGIGLARKEWQIPINSKMFEFLAKQTLGYNEASPYDNFMKKEYFCYELEDDNNGFWVLDISHVDDTFWYAEVEFGSVEEANNFKLPTEFGHSWKEVTGNPYFAMKNYYCRKNGIE
jgi:hypothetical protein